MVIDPDCSVYENTSDGAVPKYDSRSNKKPACDYCKKRKIKCDGLANCFQCHKRDLKCSYEGPAPLPKNGMIAKLTSRIKHLSSELEEQKKIANYWRSLYEAKELKKTLILSIIREKKPIFCKRSLDLCRHVASAVSTVLKAFIGAMKPLMPYNATDFCPEYSMMLWNRLINSAPEEFSVKIGVLHIESLVPLLIHSLMFAIGSSLIQYLDLAQHFHAISESLLSAISKCCHATHGELDRQIGLAHVYSIFYDILNAEFSSSRLHWQRADDFMAQSKTQHEKNEGDEYVSKVSLKTPWLNCNTLIRIIIWMAVFAPIESNDRDKWLNKLSMIDNRELHFLRNLGLAFVGLTNLETGSVNFLISRQWMNINSLEALLNRLRDSHYYQFLAVWIYGLKAISAATLSESENTLEEVSQCVNIVTQLYAQIPNQSQQLWMCRYFEYFCHVLSTVQEKHPNNRLYKQLIDVIYNIIIMVTPPDESENESFAYGNEAQISNHFENNLLVHPLVQNSPFSIVPNTPLLDLLNC